jgi:hypothetical protein
VAALQTTLAAQHAAVYAYSVIGVHLTSNSQVGTARARQGAHRQARDVLADRIVALGAEPVVAAPLYQPAEPLTDDVAAQRWAVGIESACAAGYRYQLSASGSAQAGSVRASALAGLADVAAAAAYWRGLVTPNSPTTAFPGVTG